MNRRFPSYPDKGTLMRYIDNDVKHIAVCNKSAQRVVLVEGDFINYRVKNGFCLNSGLTNELRDFQVFSTAKKSLTITILLQGKLEFSYDDLKFAWDAANEAKGVIVNIAKPVSFSRRIQKDNQLTKLNIMLPTDWVYERADLDSNVATFIDQHLASVNLVMTNKILNLAFEVIQRRSPNGLLEKIQLETLIQMLLFEIFEQVNQIKPQTYVAQRDTYHSNEIESNRPKSSFDELLVYIENNLDKVLSVRELACHVAMSESSLQRKFKAAMGCGIQNYIRHRRLRVAKQRLESGVLSISEIAYSAGYRHPSNFTNAFKKAFGFPPAELIKKEDGLPE